MILKLKKFNDLLLKKILYVYPNNINFIWNCFFKFFMIFFPHYKTIYLTFNPNALALDPTTNDFVINSISLASFDDDICPTIIIFFIPHKHILDFLLLRNCCTIVF